MGRRSIKHVSYFATDRRREPRWHRVPDLIVLLGVSPLKDKTVRE